MVIEIRERNVHATLALRAHVRRRLGFALRDFDVELDHVIVWFSPTTGHPAGVETRCEIDVCLHSAGDIRALGVDGDPFVALDRAAARVSRSSARAVERHSRVWQRATGRRTK